MVTFNGHQEEEYVEVFPAKYQHASAEKCDIKAGKSTLEFKLSTK